MIKTVDTLLKLKKIFNFLSSLFYEESVKKHETYFPMGQRYAEMIEQFQMCPEFLLYIEENDKIIAALTSKGMNLKHKKITLGVLGVDDDYRHQGYGRALVSEMERRCLKKGILEIDLGARTDACPFYLSLGYHPQLLVQVYDFITVEDIRKANTIDLKEIEAFQTETYGFIIYEINDCDAAYIHHFTERVKTANVQFLFYKHLTAG